MEETWYYIVTKTEWINNVLVTREVGYCESIEDMIAFNINYENTFGAWIRNNIENLNSGALSIGEYFQNDSIVYSANSKTTTLEGKNLPLVLPL